MKTFTSNADTPLGLPRGYSLAPKASIEVPDDDAAAILTSPYVIGWVNHGHITVTDAEPEGFGEYVAVPEEIEAE